MVRIILIILSILAIGSLMWNTAYGHNGVPTTVVVEMHKDGFSLDKIELEQGDAILFKNVDSKTHWPASNLHPSHAIYPEFDPKRPLKPGQSWQFLFEKEGKWRFHDHLYPEFTGEIIVKETPGYIAKQNNKKNNLNLKSLTDTALLETKVFIGKLYYFLFPDELEKNLATVNILAVGNDSPQITYYFRVAGMQRILAKIKEESLHVSATECHGKQHNIGRVAYLLYGADVIAKGMEYTCASGMVHGAMEAFANEYGTTDLTKNIDALCDDFTMDVDKFHCYHGIGHGMTAYMDYDFPAAIEACKNLEDQTSQDLCFGGAVMENVYDGKNLQRQNVGFDNKKKSRWLDDSDPMYPCDDVFVSKLPRLEGQCYYWQTWRVLEVYKDNFDILNQECMKAPNDTAKSWCYQGMGRDAGNKVLNVNSKDKPEEIAKIEKICRKTPDEFYQSCIKGGLFGIVELFGDTIKNEGYLLCKHVRNEDKEFCYKDLGRKLPKLYGKGVTTLSGKYPKQPKEFYKKIMNVCGYAESKFVANCLTAAGVEKEDI